MDIKKYISSGILEKYVLGMVTEVEQREVEQYAGSHPEIRAELDAIEIAMEQYAQIHELPTPVGVEAKFNQRIDELSAKNPSPPRKDDLNQKNKGGFWLPLFLVGALLATGWWAFSNSQKYNNSQSELSIVKSDLTTLETNCNETNRENEALKNTIKILQDPNNQVTSMSGEDILASVIWNSQTQKSYLNLNTEKPLPTPPAGKQYQLWAIVDGAPVNMEPFDLVLEDGVLQEVPFIENVSAFAVSLENEGGSPTPTEVIMVGNVG